MLRDMVQMLRYMAQMNSDSDSDAPLHHSDAPLHHSDAPLQRSDAMLHRSDSILQWFNELVIATVESVKYTIHILNVLI